MNMENKQGMKKIFLHSDLHIFECSGYFDTLHLSIYTYDFINGIYKQST